MSKRVLIIDDSAFMVSMLTEILEKAGYDVAGTAANGAEGFEKYQELQPDLVLLDIVMPVQDGIDTLKQIRSHDTQAKVVMLSAVSTAASTKSSLELGAVGFIAKPFQPTHLFEVLAQAVERTPLTVLDEKVSDWLLELGTRALDGILSAAHMKQIFDGAYERKPFELNLDNLPSYTEDRTPVDRQTQLLEIGRAHV